MSEIKNCPFCGEAAIKVEKGYWTLRHPRECFLSGRYPWSFYANTPGLKEWNARVLPPEVERLAKCAEAGQRYFNRAEFTMPLAAIQILDDIWAALAALKGEQHG